MAKFIFVTGGVVSGLGKGITAASLGRLLKCRGLKVASQKLDPYVNVDPGTMSPLQHGEVFVTDDGTETDLDLGHYERFIDENLNKYSNLTTGKVYWNVLNKERQGAYLGQTVQIIPHITNEIKSYIYNLASSTEADVVITEIGGTTGDIEMRLRLRLLWLRPRLPCLRWCRKTRHLHWTLRHLLWHPLRRLTCHTGHDRGVCDRRRRCRRGHYACGGIRNSDGAGSGNRPGRLLRAQIVTGKRHRTLLGRKRHSGGNESGIPAIIRGRIPIRTQITRLIALSQTVQRGGTSRRSLPHRR